MTTAALIKQADLQRMARMAKKEGVVIEVEIDGKIVRVRPLTARDLEVREPDEIEEIRL